jgi:thiol-disulfide isomerase/thioredoxin
MRKHLFGVSSVVLFLLMTQSAFAQAVRVEGQIVCCAECWAGADRTKVQYGTAEDLLKAQSCVAGGDPTLIAVREGERFTLYNLMPGKFRLPGKNWLEFIGKRVAVTGTRFSLNDKIRAFRVDTLEVLAPSIAEQQASDVIGKEKELILKDLSGTEQKLSSFKGRIVILNFWATYCIPCRKEMPDLAAIQNEYAAHGVQVIGASADDPDDRAKVRQFIKETKINFPIWLDATITDMMRFGLGSALPGTVVIDKDGKVAKVYSGVFSKAELKKQIDSMLAASEKSVAKRSEVSSVPS